MCSLCRGGFRPELTSTSVPAVKTATQKKQHNNYDKQCSGVHVVLLLNPVGKPRQRGPGLLTSFNWGIGWGGQAIRIEWLVNHPHSSVRATVRQAVSNCTPLTLIPR
jgi:hypothetical protein